MMDASAFIQSDTKIENLKTLSEFKRDNRVYSSASPANQAMEKRIIPGRNLTFTDNYSMSGSSTTRAKPGRCFSWEKKVKEKAEIKGDERILRETWESIEFFANMCIWQGKK